ncbi:hypothetical protein HQQ80_16390 [Microbacteriaceae bacterium VKM Ac-2855]|nr:hypothetical protein [Microbacteriaceae bacterium VKM Ac-2855]
MNDDQTKPILPDEQPTEVVPEVVPEAQPTLVLPDASVAEPLTPTAAEPTASAAAPAAYAPPPVETRLPARVGTIVWGILLLGFCAYTGVIALGGAAPNPVTWLTGALILGGAALVVVGIAAAARKR